MRVLKRCVKKIKQYQKSRTASLLFFTINKLLSEHVQISNSYNFVEIKDYPSLEKFSIDHNDSMNHLLNDDCRKRFANGSFIFIAMKDGEWISYGWLAVKNEFWIAEIDCVLDMHGSRVGILYDFLTRKTVRGLGIYPQLIRYIVQKHTLSDYLIYCYDYNDSSRKGIEKAKGKFEVNLRHGDMNVTKYFSSYGIRVVGSKYRCFGLKYLK